MEGDFEHLEEGFEGVFENPTYIRSQFKFRLLDLPPELMVRICQLAVIQTETFDPTKAPLASTYINWQKGYLEPCGCHVGSHID
jgi:hypothetical protein